MKMKKQPDPSAGFSLIEMVVVLSILGILLPSIMDPMFSIFLKHARIEELNRAQTLAEGKLEDLHGQSFDNILSTPTSNFTGSYNAYTYSLDVTYVEGPTNLDTVAIGTTDYKKTRIMVSTPASTNYELVTLFTNHGFK